jgi:hypothetical protein
MHDRFIYKREWKEVTNTQKANTRQKERKKKNERAETPRRVLCFLLSLLSIHIYINVTISANFL